MLDFGRDVCGDLAAAGRREWLVTNGIGGYASGTLAGLLTRRYHGLLIAALEPPVGRTLLVTRLDETASYGGGDYALYANRWQGGLVEPPGFHYLERFHLEGTTPVWTFACADALLEKRVWMQPAPIPPMCSTTCAGPARHCPCGPRPSSTIGTITAIPMPATGAWTSDPLPTGCRSLLFQAQRRSTH